MSAPRWDEILFDCAPSKFGVPFKRWRTDGTEPEAGTFTRADAATCATRLDSAGLVRRAAAGKLRASYVYGDSVPGLLLEPARTNLCLQSEDFGTTWTAVGTPTRSAGAATCGALSLDLIGDDNGAAIEGYYQVVGFTGDATKAVSVFVKAGSSPPAAGWYVELYDVTAGTDRLTAIVTFAGAVPSVAIVGGKGVYLGAVALAGGVYRLLFQTNSVTAANTHRVYVQSVETGNIYAGGVQVEDAPYPSSYIKTTTASVTRAADTLPFPIGFGPQDLTVYVKLTRPAWAALAGAVTLNCGVYDIGNGATAHQWLYADLAAGTFVAGFYGTGAVSASVAIPATGDIELAVQLDTTNGGRVRLTATGTWSSWSSTSALTAWVAQTLALGDTANTEAFGGGIQRLVVARGLFTLTEMQAAPTP